MSKYLITLFLWLVPCYGFNQLITIKEIQGESPSSPYNNQTVSTKGAVTGVYPDGYFIRENSAPWGGIYVYDPGRNPMPETGDTIVLTGLVSEYYDWTEIKTITQFEIISTGNPLPEPVVIPADDIDESWESCLLRIENTVCTNTDLGYGEWEVNDGTAPLVIDDLGVAFNPEAGQKYTLTGNLSFSFSVFKLVPRTLEDIEILAQVYITRQPYPVGISEDAVTIIWETNEYSTTEAFIGLDPSMEIGHIRGYDGMNHLISLYGFSPGDIIYLQAFSVLGEDTAKSAVTAFVTKSASSGEIRVSFNRTYTDMTFNDNPELFTNNLNDTLVSYINSAGNTLDLALYDFTGHSSASAGYNSGIEDAISEALDRGVRVRLITDADVADAAPLFESPLFSRYEVSQDGIMHHKFMIIDHDSPENSWLITGSTNPNYNNMVLDFNNLLAIQDQSLARAYLIEFEELWGGSGDDPDPEKSLSGSQKTNNSPHYFNIGGRDVELYFSPSDRTTQAIEKTLLSAGESIDFAVMAFTENILGNAIISAREKGVNIKGIIDYVEYTGSEYDYLLAAGVDVLDYQNPDGSEWPDGATLHHKFAVTDAGTKNATVITGSHNWTASAESRNDENTLIIHDSVLASAFIKESERIRDWLLNPPVRPEAEYDFFNLSNENPLIIDVALNDVYSGEYQLSIVEEPHSGNINITEENKIEYYPFEEFTSGSDSFSYELSIKSYPEFRDTARVIIQKIAGNTAELNQRMKIRIYPNPANEFIYISSPNSGIEIRSIRIINPMGQVIKPGKSLLAYNYWSMDISKLPAGIYLVIVDTDSGETRQAIIKY